MTIAPETKIIVADGDTGVVEWAGRWAEFVAENDGDDTVAEVEAELELGKPAFVGGGAAAFLKITTA